MEYVENLIFIELHALFFIISRPLGKKKRKVGSQEYISWETLRYTVFCKDINTKQHQVLVPAENTVVWIKKTMQPSKNFLQWMPKCHRSDFENLDLEVVLFEKEE